MELQRFHKQTSQAKGSQYCPMAPGTFDGGGGGGGAAAAADLQPLCSTIHQNNP